MRGKKINLSPHFFVFSLLIMFESDSCGKIRGLYKKGKRKKNE